MTTNTDPNAYLVNEVMTHLGLDFEMFEEGACKVSFIEPAYDYSRGIVYIVTLVWDDEDDKEMTSTVMMIVTPFGSEFNTIHTSPTGR